MTMTRTLYHYIINIIITTITTTNNNLTATSRICDQHSLNYGVALETAYLVSST